jgi:hypothetical protein
MPFCHSRRSITPSLFVSRALNEGEGIAICDVPFDDVNRDVALRWARYEDSTRDVGVGTLKACLYELEPEPARGESFSLPKPNVGLLEVFVFIEETESFEAVEPSCEGGLLGDLLTIGDSEWGILDAVDSGVEILSSVRRIERVVSSVLGTRWRAESPLFNEAESNDMKPLRWDPESRTWKGFG